VFIGYGLLLGSHVDAQRPRGFALRSFDSSADRSGPKTRKRPESAGSVDRVTARTLRLAEARFAENGGAQLPGIDPPRFGR